MTKQPKIVIFDLETLPNLPSALRSWCQLGAFPFRTMKATVSTIICAGWKIHGKKKTHCINAWDYPKRWAADVNDDYEVCKAIFEVLKDADAVVTHNGVRFDWKFLQTRLLIHKIGVLDKIPHIDTIQIAKRNFFSFSNALGYLGELLVDDKKLAHTGWQLWVDVHGRKKKAMKLMTKYCKQDVDLLEKLFVELTPYIKNLPNRNQFRSMAQIIDGQIVCPNCGSIDVTKDGWRRTKTQYYQRIYCKQCNTYARCDGQDKNPRTY